MEKIHKVYKFERHTASSELYRTVRTWKVLVQCTAINITFLLTFTEGDGNGFL
jgi:hypothetical protein